MSPPFSYLAERNKASHRVRLFDVIINGTAALTNYDILSTVGVRHTAVVEQCLTTADHIGQIILQFLPIKVDATLSGIEVMPRTMSAGHSRKPVIRINCGGGAIGEWAADRDFQGGECFADAHAINTTRARHPAPSAVYQSKRWGQFSYRLRGLTPGARYTVRLHFVEHVFAGVFEFCFKYTLAGSGMVAIDGITQEITAGCATINTSYNTCRFTATSTNEPWEFLTLYLQGQDFREYIEDIIQRFPPVLRLPSSHPAVHALYNIFLMLWRRPDVDGLTLDEKIFHFILALLHSADDQSIVPLHSQLSDAEAMLMKHLAEELTFTDMARLLGMNTRAVYDFFRQTANTTPIAYLTHLRLQQASELLRGTCLSISEIADRCGFTDVNYFSRIFRKHLRMTPTNYRKQAGDSG